MILHKMILNIRTNSITYYNTTLSIMILDMMPFGITTKEQYVPQHINNLSVIMLSVVQLNVVAP